jgi:hypothetical protein
MVANIFLVAVGWMIFVYSVNRMLIISGACLFLMNAVFALCAFLPGFDIWRLIMRYSSIDRDILVEEMVISAHIGEYCHRVIQEHLFREISLRKLDTTLLYQLRHLYEYNLLNGYDTKAIDDYAAWLTENKDCIKSIQLKTFVDQFLGTVCRTSSGTAKTRVHPKDFLYRYIDDYECKTIQLRRMRAE